MKRMWRSVVAVLPDVRDLVFRYIEEVSRNYDIDGIKKEPIRWNTAGRLDSISKRG